MAGIARIIDATDEGQDQEQEGQQGLAATTTSTTPTSSWRSKEGYRARAAYKLKEIDEALGLLKPGPAGGRPGRGARRLEPVRAAQVRAQAASRRGRRAERHDHRARHAADSSRSKACNFIQGDFREDEVLAAAGGGAGRAGRSTWWSPTWRPTCRASQSPTRRASPHLVELAVEFAPAPPEARGRAGVQGVSRQRLQPARQAVQGDVSRRQADQAQGSRDKSAETFLVGIGLKRAEVPARYHAVERSCIMAADLEPGSSGLTGTKIVPDAVERRPMPGLARCSVPSTSEKEPR